MFAIKIVSSNINRDEEINNMITHSTKKYVYYVQHHLNSKEDFIAHVYVRYLGDLRGGQMIAKKIPGSGQYYKFENSKELASSLYNVINNDMAEEAKKVFNFATKLFIEMYENNSKRK